MPITGLRQYIINGQCLVKVKGRGALLNIRDGLPDVPDNIDYNELGLTSDQIMISYNPNFKDMIVDDFGPKTPAEVMPQLAEMYVSMTLIHYDPSILQACISESMGGAHNIQTYNGVDFPIPRPEMMFPANRPLGGGVPVLRQGCHYIQLFLTSPVLATPWLFPTAYIMSHTAIPNGTEASAPRLVWRSIPYTPIYEVSALSTSPGEITVLSGSFSSYRAREPLASGSLIYDRYNQNLFYQIHRLPLSGIDVTTSGNPE